MQMKPFFDLSDHNLLLEYGFTELYDRPDSNEAAFDINCCDMIPDFMLGGYPDCDILADVDYRNYSRCKLCNLNDLVTPTSGFSLTHLNLRSLTAYYGEREAVMNIPF